MAATDIVGYTADGDVYCPEHAEKKYGKITENSTDREGNTIKPIFNSDDWQDLDCNAGHSLAKIQGGRKGSHWYFG